MEVPKNFKSQIIQLNANVLFDCKKLVLSNFIFIINFEYIFKIFDFNY